MRRSFPSKCWHQYLSSAGVSQHLAHQKAQHFWKGKSVMFYNRENFLKKMFNKTCFPSFALCTVCGVELGENDTPLKLAFLLQTSARYATAAPQPQAEHSVFQTHEYKVVLLMWKAWGTLRAFKFWLSIIIGILPCVDAYTWQIPMCVFLCLFYKQCNTLFVVRQAL